MTTPADRDHLQVFNDAKHVGETLGVQWYWHRQSANGKLVASGGESFTREEDALRAAYRANPDLDPNNDPEVFGDKP